RTDSFIMLEVYRLVIIVAKLRPVAPCAHERMLKDGQLIRVVAQVVEQLLHQALRDAGATHGYRPFNSPALLISRELRNEVVTIVKLTGEFRKLGTVANEVRPHGDGHINGGVRITAGFHQKVDERKCFIYG